MLITRRVAIACTAFVLGFGTWVSVTGVSAAPPWSATGSTTTTIKEDSDTTTTAPPTTTTTIEDDLCPNIVGVQATIPSGMFIDAAGNCVPIVDRCVIGGTGPGGGIVFYVASSPQPWGRCLEAAPQTWSGETADPVAAWGCAATNITGAQGTAIGTGQANTTAIVAACTINGIAARLADNLIFGGKLDWFLPSKDALAQMYANAINIGGFATDIYYWSSSVFSPFHAWFQSFNGGYQSASIKNNLGYVRPVRAFS